MRIAVLVCLTVLSFSAIFGIFGLSPYALTFASGASSGSGASPASWHHTTRYPVLSNGQSGIEGQGCVSYSGFIYCVGGTGNDFAPISDVNYAKMNGLPSTSWHGTTPYPQLSTGSNGVVGESCVQFSGYIFCIGGYDKNYVLVPDAFYAPILPKGIRSWQATHSYPLSTEGMSCVVSLGYIYCVGGYLGGNTFSSAAYFAPISSSGIGAWQSTNSYPTLSTGNPGIAGEACVAFSSHIYCVAGEDDARNSVADVYYASIGPTGIGAWQKTTSYPVAEGSGSCAQLAGQVFCMGGFTVSTDTSASYKASLMSSGILSWQKMPSYPKRVDTGSCAIGNELLYCVGGVDFGAQQVISNVYFRLV